MAEKRKHKDDVNDYVKKKLEEIGLKKLIEGLLLFIGCLPIYMIHLLISIRLGSGASIGFGFTETLIALQ